MTTVAVVTDIEGTTSAISFVHDVLFPYASRELPEFVRRNSGIPEIAALLDDVRLEAGEPGADTDRVIELLRGWIAEDRKVTPLKSLQGYVWRRGYERGDFTGHIYADAADRLRRWSVSGIRLYVYSSGSVAAQQLLFRYSVAGDLRSLFSGWFDTRTGHKKEADSYRRIIGEIGAPAAHILFLSDVAAELDAAAMAGMRTCQLVRDENVAVGAHPVARSFDDVIID